MKLLITTQVVDAKDPVLGFFVRWIEEIAKHYEQVTVICLRMGTYTLPENVRVYSLGKERGRAPRIVYAVRFIRIAWRLRSDYEAVFVHMNQEHVLLAGLLWKALCKRVYLWRNHYAGSWLTSVTVAFCTKVFFTSKHSFTARYRKATLMPVGVDTNRFKPNRAIVRKFHSILFLSRMSPSKRPEMLVEALGILAREGHAFKATFVGSPLPQDDHFYNELKAKVKALGIADVVTFHPAVANDQAPDLYCAHEIFVNTSPSGMLDKTIFEAAACGCLSLSSSLDWQALAGESAYFSDAASLAKRLDSALRGKASEGCRSEQELVLMHALETLVRRIVEEV